jgi:hypothetical protein
MQRAVRPDMRYKCDTTQNHAVVSTHTKIEDSQPGWQRGNCCPASLATRAPARTRDSAELDCDERLTVERRTTHHDHLNTVLPHIVHIKVRM